MITFTKIPWVLASLISLAAISAAAAAQNLRTKDPSRHFSTDLRSLKELSIKALRARHYQSRIRIERVLDLGGATDSRVGGEHYLASFSSDHLHEYVRVDVPVAPMPPGGYPVVLFLHGWVGAAAAPRFDFRFRDYPGYELLISEFCQAGFLVLTPGFRGHGVPGMRQADGLKYLEIWDNGTYVSPAFYAIDALNLLAGAATLESADWSRWGLARPVRIDRTAINVLGHSQGGDVALMVLAAASLGSSMTNPVHAGSIWAGTFAPRVVQLEIYQPMETSPQAFVSGDGSWTGTAIAPSGAVNPNFVFGYPSDSIETPRPSAWTWQRSVWSNTTVAAALAQKLDEMYTTLAAHVRDLKDIHYAVRSAPNGRADVVHDPRVSTALRYIGAFDSSGYLTVPINLEHSDRDFYSLASWNAELCSRIRRSGGRCYDFTYRGNTHLLGKSEHAWYSPAGTRAGFEQALRRDMSLFVGDDPSRVPGQ